MMRKRIRAADRMMIPSDIITEILYRLPAESLCRFRCVSKYWQSIITDPKFIKTHRITLNRNHHILCDIYCMLLYSHPFHHHDYFIFKPTKLPIESTDRYSLAFHGSCDGLVLISVSGDLVVFNPSTRESVQLPQAPGHYPHHLGDLEQDFVHSNPSTHGIGHDSVTDDYKVITLTSFEFSTDDIDVEPYRRNWVTSTTIRVSIYILKSNTWRELFIDSPCQFRYQSSDSFHAVYFNGFLHWFGTKKDTNRSKVLMAFSLVDECVREVPSPNFCNDVRNCKLMVLGGKLAIYGMPFDRWSRCVNIEAWLMNEYGVKDSWIKIPLDILNDEVYMEDPMFFYDNDKIRVATGRLILIYDFENRTFGKNVYICSDRFLVFGSYCETLVSPKGKDATNVLQILE